MISVFIWKGFWDLFETGLENLLKSHPNAKFLSICITGLIGYALYFILLSYEYLINKCKFNCMNVSNQKDFVYLFSLVAVVAVWRFLWDGYDYFVLESNYQVYVMIGTHFGTLILLFLFQVGTILYVIKMLGSRFFSIFITFFFNHKKIRSRRAEHRPVCRN